MNQPMKRLLYWAPRILTILFAAFISIFALDVFGEGYGLWKTIVALAMHLIPTGVILLTLLIAWRWEWAGGLIFIGMASWYSLRVFHHHPGWIPVIASPGFLVGLLFLLNWVLRQEFRARPTTERRIT
jgi:hypothetical protein